jgi:hypothetical protein
MTIPSPSDDLVSPPLLDDRRPVRSVIENFWETQNDVFPRGALGRLFGRSPLSSTSRPWYVAALGERQVAERLRALAAGGQSWRVLHAVPVDARGSDIDHVVIGPAGVFALQVRPQATGALEQARSDASRAAILLEHSHGGPVGVTPIVVVVGPARSLRPVASEVVVVPAARIDRYLVAQRPVHSVDQVRDLTRAALKPRTWPSRAPRGDVDRAGSTTLPSQHDLHLWFTRVRAEVDSARRVQALWAAGAAMVLIAEVALGPGIVQGLIG